MKVLVLGASLKEERYSNKAIKMLNEYKHDVLAIGLRSGMVDKTLIETEMTQFNDVDTVTLYLNPARQKGYYQYILNLKPRRVIFNPGSENPEFYELLQEENIENEVACTLVLLRTDQF